MKALKLVLNRTGAKPSVTLLVAMILYSLIVGTGSAAAQTAMPKTYTITKTLTGNQRFNDGSTIIFSGGQIRNGTITGKNLRIVANGDNVIFNSVKLSGSICDSKLKATHFGAVSDMTSRQKNWSYKGKTWKIKERTGTDNDPVWERIANFLSGSNNVVFTINGNFYSASFKSTSIKNAHNLTISGGTFVRGLDFQDCTDIYIENVNIVGFHEVHDFPPIIFNSKSAAAEMTLNGKKYTSSNAFIMDVDRMQNMGVAGNGITATLATAGKKCENINISGSHIEMHQSGVLIGTRTQRKLARKVNVSNCTFSHIFYQPIGFHCEEAVVDNVTADYCLQGIDFSTFTNKCTVKNSKFYDCCSGPKQETPREHYMYSYNNRIENCEFHINDKYLCNSNAHYILSLSEGADGDVFTVVGSRFEINKTERMIQGFICKTNKLLLDNVVVNVNAKTPKGEKYGLFSLFTSRTTRFSPMIECRNVQVTCNARICYLSANGGALGPKKLQLTFTNSNIAGSGELTSGFKEAGSVKATSTNFKMKTPCFAENVSSLDLRSTDVENVDNIAINSTAVSDFDCTIANSKFDVRNSLIKLAKTSSSINISNSEIQCKNMVDVGSGVTNKSFKVTGNQVNVSGTAVFTGFSSGRDFSSKKMTLTGNKFRGNGSAKVFSDSKSDYSRMVQQNTTSGIR